MSAWLNGLVEWLRVRIPLWRCRQYRCRFSYLEKGQTRMCGRQAVICFDAEKWPGKSGDWFAVRKGCCFLCLEHATVWATMAATLAGIKTLPNTLLLPNDLQQNLHIAIKSEALKS